MILREIQRRKNEKKSSVREYQIIHQENIKDIKIS